MSKRNQQIAAGRAGHRVLIFGEEVFGADPSIIKTHENANIDVVPCQDYGKLKRLTAYTLVILNYAPFHPSRAISTAKQNVFDKMIWEALNEGTTFCFVHYNEEVPEYDGYAHDIGYMNEKHFLACRDQQLGFRYLNPFSIRPRQSRQPIVSGHVKRAEFRPFLSKWGASHNYFSAYRGGELGDIIYENGESVLAFSVTARAGRIIMMPFQRDFDHPDDLKDGLYTLVDCLLTYITKSLTELPDWARTPFFAEEKTVYDDCQELEKQLDDRLKALELFVAAKALMFQAEYTLERTVPTFITEHLHLKTERNEQFKEDFWILNASGERVVVGEVKSYVKGLKRTGIFSVYNHREANKLAMDFPGLLVVNAHMQAASWAEKDRPIDKQHYEIAAQNNILVVRTEDIVRLWDALRAGRLTSEAILAALTTKSGWLQVQSDGTITEHR